jgi:hypothetical protein
VLQAEDDESGAGGEMTCIVQAVVVGYLGAHESDFQDATGRDVALWRVVYDNEDQQLSSALSASLPSSGFDSSLAGDVEDLEEEDIKASIPKNK